MNRPFQTIPAKAATHGSAVRTAEKWAPASARVDKERTESLPTWRGS
jgi:hypothetical protein